MPYLPKEYREMFDDALHNVVDILDVKIKSVNGDKTKLSGFLNYCITKLVWSFIHSQSEKYDAYNAAIGALECAKLELYRRKVAEYEDGKIESNGDVYFPSFYSATTKTTNDDQQKVALEEVANLLSSIGRSYIAKQLLDGKYRVGAVVDFLLTEPYLEKEDREVIDKVLQIAKEAGL
jgi:hypothetical protein